MFRIPNSKFLLHSFTVELSSPIVDIDIIVLYFLLVMVDSYNLFIITFNCHKH